MDKEDLDKNAKVDSISSNCKIPDIFLNKISMKDVKIGDITRIGEVTLYIYYMPKLGKCYDLDNNKEVYIKEIDNKYSVLNNETITILDTLYCFSGEIDDYKEYIPI